MVTHSSLEFGIFLRRTNSFIIIRKSPSQCLYKAGLRQRIDLRVRSSHSRPRENCEISLSVELRYKTYAHVIVHTAAAEVL